MNDEAYLKISRPFGPSLGIVNIPEGLINKINNFIDEKIEDKNKKSTLIDHGSKLAGQVTQEIKLPQEIIEGKLLEFLGAVTKTYIRLSCKKEITKFKLIDAWVVRQFQNEYNPIHFHGGHISGVGYLQLPDNFGETIQENKKNVHGNINFVHGTHQFLSDGSLSIKPKIGDFYIFPNYLFHSVNPFTGPGERRSISFNAKIDDEIFNVYGKKL